MTPIPEPYVNAPSPLTPGVAPKPVPKPLGSWLVPPGRTTEHECRVPVEGFTPNELDGAVWRCPCGAYSEVVISENGLPMTRRISARRAAKLQRRKNR